MKEESIEALSKTIASRMASRAALLIIPVVTIVFAAYFVWSTRVSVKQVIDGLTERLGYSLTVGDSYQLRADLTALAGAVPGIKYQLRVGDQLIDSNVKDSVGGYELRKLKRLVHIDHFSLFLRQTYLIPIGSDQEARLVVYAPIQLFSLGFAFALAILGLWGFRLAMFNFGARLNEAITQPIARLHSEIESQTGAGVIDFRLSDRTGIVEINTIFNRMANLSSRHYLLKLKNQELEKRRELADITARVAHDIKSPLSVLRLLVRKDDSEENRLVVQAIDRIESIVDDVKKRTSRAVERSFGPSREHEPGLSVPSAMSRVVNEKSIEYGSRCRLVLDQVNLAGRHVLAPVEFERVISNLINNAIESFKSGRGEIFVGVEIAEHSVRVEVRDNGCGIPKDVLPFVTKADFSLGKESGTGIGLSHAAEMVELWGGDLDIASSKENGTIVCIAFPG